MAPPEPKRRVKASTAWREFRLLLAEHRQRLLVGLLLILLNSGTSLVLPGSSKYLVDDVASGKDPGLILQLAVVAGIAVTLQACSSFALSRLLSIAAQRAVTDMRIRVQAHIGLLPVSYFDSVKSGQLISRIMTDAEGVRNLVGTGLVQLVGGALTASAAFAVLCWLNWRMTMVTLVVIAVCMAIFVVAFSRLRPLFRKRGEINAEVTGRLAESLGAVRTIKAYVAEEREAAVFRGGAERLFDNVRRSITGVSATTALTTLCIGVVGVTMIVMGGHAMAVYAASGHQAGMSSGDFFAYVMFTGMVAAPVIQMAAIGTQISEAFAGLDRIREVLALGSEASIHGGGGRITELTGEVACEGLCFSYVEGQQVLTDITFTAPAGSTTALVGTSGSGKSTLVSLIMGFHRPLAGLVRIDGHDLRSLALDTLRAHLGVVFQDNVLFDGTIAENIAFSRPGAQPEEIRAAGELAGCGEFVRGFKDGWDTVVGERGVKLSGGQRQRIGIARAILANPRVLVLDEATSSLDSESEALVQEGLKRLRQGRTTFVIAHRLSTIRSADQILVLEAGRIIERGTHAELHAAHGRYRALHDRQFLLEQDRYLNPGEEPRELAPGLGTGGNGAVARASVSDGATRGA